jgi:voltage-dependent calcium channel T type alpha-1G
MLLHNICTSPYFDFLITAVICVNVITMSIEFYMMPSVNNNNIKFLNQN